MLDEEFFRLKEVPALLPDRPHLSTVWRWVTRGCRGVKLETIRIGARRYTSRSAVRRFVDELSRGEALPSPLPPIADARVDQALDRAGL
jgi:hypothetical protein